MNLDKKGPNVNVELLNLGIWKQHELNCSRSRQLE